MVSEHHSDTNAAGQHPREEGPRNHYLAYIISILLTMLAFAVVLYGELDRSFILMFLVGLALIQAVFQLTYWMHMKDKGHLFPIIGIMFGFIIALTAVAMAVWWLWW
ncbi:cytochrome C oxidase subunit IV family protein [Paenibacillus thalictri]|uniref:Cytochrome C oxidase subunit IV n=1 Tax=Paenibacillus thalictri TaxID=2527873 RepID=A0A4Q9DKD6_9BACL|nr:cytochrome C oxidase subunit IV family protein [Paenibacillus thalictri]TBL71204.1 cytochrome C oxidase subunit IV [Paenibacillus thalictri]